MNTDFCFHRVWNISKVKIGGAYSFPSTDDHSKWGVSDAESDWICVGDINRAVRKTQFISVNPRIILTIKHYSICYR